MAGGVPYGATEGSSMGPGLHHCFFTFSGSFLGTLSAPKMLFFARKKQHFDVHFGVQNGVLRGAHFSSFSLFSGSFLGTPFAPKTSFSTMKNQDFEVHFGRQNGVLRRPFFSSFFVFFKNALMVNGISVELSVLR